MDGKPWFWEQKWGLYTVQRVYLADGTTAQLKFLLLDGTTEERRPPTIADVDIPSSYQAVSLNFSAIEKFLKHLDVFLPSICKKFQ